MCSLGQLLLVWIAGALRAGGDARTGLRGRHVDGRGSDGTRPEHNPARPRVGTNPRVRRDGGGASGRQSRPPSLFGRGHLADGDGDAWS